MKPSIKEFESNPRYFISHAVNIKHGYSKTRLYNIWIGIKNRCYKPSAVHYEYYGGRGISVCDDWLNDFESFWDWAFDSGYGDNLSIDRIDNDGNYCPKNCRWATRKQQNQNMRHLSPAVFIDPDGDEIIIQAGLIFDFCKDNGLNPRSMYPVLNGRRKHNFGWRAYYISKNALKGSSATGEDG